MDLISKEAEVFVLDGLQLVLDTAVLGEDAVRAIQRGHWEAGERNLAAKILEPGDRVIECGTCIGAVSMVLARLVGIANVFSFEANPTAIGLARRNFARNSLPVSIEHAMLVNRIAYERAGIIGDFYVNNGAIVSSNSIPGKNRTKINVPIRCLEDEIERTGSNVLFLDIEGGEADLLTGADLRGINKIAMETHYRKVGRKTINQMIRYLHSQGFDIDLSLTRGELVYLYREN